MNLKNLLFFSILCLSSCTSDECVFPDAPIPPAGYTISKIGLIEDVSPSQSADEFQMVNSTIGYALKNEIEDKRLFKTEDGGATWTSTVIPFNFSIESMLFTDENNGYITHRGDDSGAFILKTADGGTTWENLAFPEFPFHFRNLVKDNDNNLYAILGGLGLYTALVKSTDAGLSWNEIYNVDDTFLSLLTAVDDRLYFKQSSDRLQVADLEGMILQSIPVEGNEQLSVINENNIIVVNQYQVNKTTDGGANWTKIFDNAARVIDFSETEGLLMLLNKEYCGDNPNELSAFGIGTVSGSTLEESEPMIDFETWTLENIQKIEEGHYLLQRGNDIFELKKL